MYMSKTNFIILFLFCLYMGYTSYIRSNRNQITNPIDIIIDTIRFTYFSLGGLAIFIILHSIWRYSLNNEV